MKVSLSLVALLLSCAGLLAYGNDDPEIDEPKTNPMDFTVGTGVLAVEHPVAQNGANGEFIAKGSFNFLDSHQSYQWHGTVDLTVPVDSLEKMKELHTIDAVIGGRWKVSGRETDSSYIKDGSGISKYSRISVGFDLLFTQLDQNDPWNYAYLKPGGNPTHPGDMAVLQLGEVNQTLLGVLATIGYMGLTVGDRSLISNVDGPKIYTWEVSLKAGVGSLNFEAPEHSIERNAHGGMVQATANFFTDYDDGTDFTMQYTGLLTSATHWRGLSRLKVGARFNVGPLIAGAGLELTESNLGESDNAIVKHVASSLIKIFVSLGFKVF